MPPKFLLLCHTYEYGHYKNHVSNLCDTACANNDQCSTSIRPKKKTVCHKSDWTLNKTDFHDNSTKYFAQLTCRSDVRCLRSTQHIYTQTQNTQNSFRDCDDKIPNVLSVVRRIDDNVFITNIITSVAQLNTWCYYYAAFPMGRIMDRCGLSVGLSVRPFRARKSKTEGHIQFTLIDGPNSNCEWP